MKSISAARHGRPAAGGPTGSPKTGSHLCQRSQQRTLFPIGVVGTIRDVLFTYANLILKFPLLIVYRAFVLLEFVKKTNRTRLSTLKSVSRDVGTLRFATLNRPRVPYGDPPTIELVDWVTKLYCFSVLCHFRALLKSLVLLTKAKHAPAVFIIARSLYEIGAHSYYVQKHVKQYRLTKDVGQAWKFMESVNMGSLYMNQKSASASPSRRSFPQPRDIGKIIRCFDEWPQNKRPGHASDTYSYLSEFAHPNMAAFEHYYEMASTGDNIFVRFH